MAVTNVTPPVLGGTARVGYYLTTTPGTWTSDDPLGYTYQWRRCDAVGANCNDIAGATSSQYLCQSADLGLILRSKVTATEIPPGSGFLYDQISDFDPPELLNPGAANYRITEVSTVHGPGFRFIMDYPGGAGQGVQIIDGPAGGSGSFFDINNYLGVTLDLSGWIMFPASGNTSGTTGFAPFWDFNALWEYGPGYTWNNQWGVEGPTRKIYVRSYKQGNPDSRQKATSAQFDFDTWYSWRWVVKSSEGSDGFVQFYWNGTDITGGTWVGPTQPPGQIPPWMQLGYYSANVTNNEVFYADVRRN